MMLLRGCLGFHFAWHSITMRGLRVGIGIGFDGRSRMRIRVLCTIKRESVGWLASTVICTL